MTCAQGLLRLLWGGARSWSATGLTSLQRNPGRVPQAVAEYGESLDLCINVRWMKILRLKIRLVGFNGLL